MNQPVWQQALTALVEVTEMGVGKPGDRYADAWCSDRYYKYGIGAAQPSYLALINNPTDLARAEPIYVTEEMQGLVYMAMETFDRTEPMGLNDVFLQSGFALLEHQFMSEDSRGFKTGWRAISWCLDPNALTAPDHVAEKYD